MPSKTRTPAFKARLLAAQRAGNMTVADLQRWFDRSYATVRSWTEGAEPGGGPIDREHAMQMLGLLEELIKRKKGFPIPRLAPEKRIEHLLTIRKAVMEVRVER